jgi:hypothetical protein
MQTLSNAGNSLYSEIPKCENTQMETISRVELAWLAGIIDGEGYIVLTWMNQKEVKKARMRTEIGVSNTDMRMVARISEISHKANIKFYYTLKNPSKRNSKKYAITISILGFRSCKKFLELVLPYLVCKKDQAETMLEYITYRISLFKYPNGNGQLDSNGRFAKRPSSYGEIDQYYWQTMRDLKIPPIDPQRLQRKASHPLQLG